MGTVCDAERVRCRTERMEKYVAELERNVYEHGDVAAEVDAMREYMSAGLAMVAAMKVKQTSMFHDLAAAHGRAARDCAERSKRLAAVRADNERRRRQLNRSRGRYDRHKAAARQLKARWAALRTEAGALRRRRADAAAAAERGAGAQRCAETELEARDRQLAAVRAEMAAAVAEQDRLAREARADRQCADRLRTSDVDALKAAIDDAVRSLRADAAELRCREDETAAAVSELGRQLDECRAETAGHEKRAADVRRDVRRVYGEFGERRARAAAQLEAEANGAGAELVAVNKRLCVERATAAELKRRIACLERSNGRSEATRERLRLEARRFREAAELTAHLVREERERRDEETRAAKSKLASGAGPETDASSDRQLYDDEPPPPPPPPPERCDTCPGQESSLCSVYASCDVVSARVVDDDVAASPQQNLCEQCTVE